MLDGFHTVRMVAFIKREEFVKKLLIKRFKNYLVAMLTFLRISKLFYGFIAINAKHDYRFKG